MEKLQNLLSEIFNARLEKIAELTEKDTMEHKKQRETLIIEDYFPEVSDAEIYKIESFIDLVVDQFFDEMEGYNEKYYTIDFSDAIKLLIECLQK